MLRPCRSAATAHASDRSNPVAHKTSIAVLPVLTIGQIVGENYLTDGIVEDLITSLARIPNLVVIARKPSFALSPLERRSRRIASELGVRYLLGGSLR